MLQQRITADKGKYSQKLVWYDNTELSIIFSITVHYCWNQTHITNFLSQKRTPEWHKRSVVSGWVSSDRRKSQSAAVSSRLPVFWGRGMGVGLGGGCLVSISDGHSPVTWKRSMGFLGYHYSEKCPQSLVERSCSYSLSCIRKKASREKSSQAGAHGRQQHLWSGH